MRFMAQPLLRNKFMGLCAAGAPSFSRSLREGGAFDLRSRMLTHSSFQIVSRLIDPSRNVLDDLRNLRNLTFRFLPFLLIHIFADRCDRLGTIPRVRTRRVNLILEPGTLRKSLFTQEEPWHFEQVRIDQIRRSGWRTLRLPTCQDLRIALSTFLQKINRILHGSKIHIGRQDLYRRSYRWLPRIGHRGEY